MITDTSETERQDEVSRFLSRSQSHGPNVEPIKVVETHVSRVFLAGQRAYKMKRAVKFPYLDFSTLENRRQVCEAEVAINKRTAPGIYRGVVAVSRDGGRLVLDSGNTGEVIEWLVEMNRFDEQQLFDRRAQRGELDRHGMEQLAEHIAAFHRDAVIRLESGGAAGIRMIIDNNAESFETAAAGVFVGPEVAAMNARAGDLAAELASALDARRDAGAVRHCHGDLHLRNICMFDGRPTLFDAIEFNRSFSEIDTLYDLAFLLMDLDFRGLRRQASFVFNRYLDATGDGVRLPGEFSVLPLFLSMRAAVRAHVDGTQAAMLSDPEMRAKRAGEAQRYLQMAIDYLEPAKPRLLAVGGLSGSGKSRMARELAPDIGVAPGARVVRTDAVRKRLLGVGLDQTLAADGYTGEMHRRTYEAFYEEIREALAQGQSVIADAVFSNLGQRRAVADIAAELGVAFDGLWLDAPPEVMEKRVAERRGDVSDATVEVLRQQYGYDLGAIDWHRVDSGGTRDDTVAEGRQIVESTENSKK